ncbi:MAG: flippase [Calditrichaeota bacterium]|nr:MAG: flippase [Calditrichota bacterium]
MFTKRNYNLFYISSYSFFDRLSSLVLVVLIARYLGAETYGLYAFVFSLANILAIFADLGINQLLTRELSAKPENQTRYFPIALGIKFAATCLTLILALIISNFLPSLRSSILIVFLLNLSHLLRILSTTFFSVVRAHLQMKYESFAGLLNRLIALVGGATLIILGKDLVSILWIFVIAAMVELLYITYIVYSRFMKFKIVLNFFEQKRLIFSALPFLVLIALPIINYRFDSILLGLFSGQKATGIYNAAYVLILNFIIIQQIAGRLLLPLLAKVQEQQKTAFEEFYQDVIKLLVVIALFAVLLVEGFGKEIIITIYGSEYLESVLCLKILIFAVIFMFASHVLSTALIALNQEKKVIKAWTVTVLMNIVLNMVLIPSYSYLGASIATVISEITLFAVNYYSLFYAQQYTAFFSREWFRLAIPFSAGLIFIGITDGLSIWVGAPLLILIYGAFLFNSRVFSRDEISRIVRLIKI